MYLPRIVVIGAGSVGSTSAAVMAQRNLGSIFLYDIVEDLAVGRAMDINQASPYLQTDCRVIGSNSLTTLNDADIVVIAAGIARQAGMSRLDLLKMNLEVIHCLGLKIMESCPRAMIFVVTNPVDILTWYMKSTWPSMNVFGLGCALDSMRFRFFIAEAATVSVESCQGMVIGTHDDNMVPVTSSATVCGIPLKDFMDREKIDWIVNLTKKAGTTIVQKLKHHSGYYAAGHEISQVVESIVFNRMGIYPLSVFCSGEYGYRNTCLALPSVVGHNGISRIIDMDLDEAERFSLDVCASSMENIIKEMRK